MIIFSNAPLHKMPKADLHHEIQRCKFVSKHDDLYLPEEIDAARERLRQCLNELTRRELQTLGWTASALIAGIAFFLGGAVAFLLH